MWSRAVTMPVEILMVVPWREDRRLHSRTFAISMLALPAYLLVGAIGGTSVVTVVSLACAAWLTTFAVLLVAFRREAIEPLVEVTARSARVRPGGRSPTFEVMLDDQLSVKRFVDAVWGSSEAVPEDPWYRVVYDLRVHLARNEPRREALRRFLEAVAAGESAAVACARHLNAYSSEVPTR